MTTGMAPLTERPAWKALEAHYQQGRDLHLRRLFADDPGRGERLTAEAVGLYLDYSKNRITDETLKLLLQGPAARRASVPEFSSQPGCAEHVLGDHEEGWPSVHPRRFDTRLFDNVPGRKGPGRVGRKLPMVMGASRAPRFI
jgi:hypothetical protein